MRTMIRFLRTMLLMPKPWLVWIALLVALNMVAPLFFIATIEAKVAIAAINLGAILQAMIFHRKGFVRLLGLGHSPWLLMLPWFALRLAEAQVCGPFQYWLLSVIAINGLSLLIDIADVVRYCRGEREVLLALE